MHTNKESKEESKDERNANSKFIVVQPNPGLHPLFSSFNPKFEAPLYQGFQTKSSSFTLELIGSNGNLQFFSKDASLLNYLSSTPHLANLKWYLKSFPQVIPHQKLIFQYKFLVYNFFCLKNIIKLRLRGVLRIERKFKLNALKIFS